ncbi:DUF2269 domain-containing protein [Actinokineospora sp. HUAS TT18]|uniref:DUF2269 domain-containing protein n=1 Tax=Actinokineospora sp. HUAS TT18 TaxID=3447451 RepID=UPI003F520124
MRKLALTLHVVFSVGWVGAVGAYLVLALTGLTSGDAALVRGVYLAMGLLAWTVVVPLSLASLLSGLVSSLGSQWGLVKHYWVLFKLVINLVATGFLLLYTRSIDFFAGVAGRSEFSTADLALLRDPTHVLHASVALLLLLGATVLAVYKPRGLVAAGRGVRTPRPDDVRP